MNHTSTADVVAVLVRKNKCLAVPNVIPKLGKTRPGLDSADTRVKEYARIVAAYEYAVAAASRLQGDDFHDVSVSSATIPWKQSPSIVGTVANWSLMTRTAPENLVALWMLATLDGIGSVRELDRRYSSDFVYLWICGGVGINDHTLSDFHSQQAEFLQRLRVDSVAALARQGLVPLETIAQEGMRVEASAGSRFFNENRHSRGCNKTPTSTARILTRVKIATAMNTRRFRARTGQAECQSM